MASRKVRDTDAEVVPLGLFSGLTMNLVRCGRLACSRRRPVAAVTSAAVLLAVVYCLTLHSTQSLPRCGSLFWLLPASRSQLLRGFSRRTTDVEKAKIVSALRVVSEALRPAGVTYFLYSGSLLGSYRHHGLVPWDDDVDILANYSQIGQLTNALNSLAGYKLYTGFPLRFKFFPRDGNPIAGKDWRWPYIDICFFIENTTHVFDILPVAITPTKYNYPKDYVFPLVNRPYEDLMLPAPRHTRQIVLLDIDDLGMCESNGYSHRVEADTPKYLQCSAPCELLFDVYPFVSHEGNGPNTTEELRLGNVSLSMYIPEDHA